MKLYIDFISQPSRAVKSVFDLLKINYELKTLKVQFKEHQTEEYAKINPLKLVPAIQDGNFLLAESHSIMKYAIRTNNIKTTLYPFDEIQNCARIDEYLDYHHTNTRKCMHLFHNVLISPKLNETIETDTQFVLRDVKKVFEYLNQKLQNQQYLCGNQLTLADISACCEIMQLHMIKFDFAVYPHLDAWLYKVFSVPEIKANHEVALKIIKKQNPDCRYLK